MNLSNDERLVSAARQTDRGIVTISNRPFVTVRLQNVYIEEWSAGRIAKYGVDLFLWERFGYLRRFSQRRFTGRVWRWMAEVIGVPDARPNDREINIHDSVIKTSPHTAGIFLNNTQH